jgi:hypothetical protein
MEIEKQSKGIKGGKRPGAGRKVGVPNKTTQEQREAVKASGLSPLDYMLSVMRDEGQDEARRLAAANMAAPYVHAKLSSMELTGKDGGALEAVTRVELVSMKGNGDGTN